MDFSNSRAAFTPRSSHRLSFGVAQSLHVRTTSSYLRYAPNDLWYSYVACWKYMGEDKEPELIKEPLDYEFTERKTRNYKS